MKLRLFILLSLAGSIGLEGCSGDGDLDDRTDITGRVVDADTGDPIEGAAVETGPETQNVLTDADGQYIIQDAFLGRRYQVSATAQGYTGDSKPLDTTIIGPNTVDFALALIPVCEPGEQRCIRGSTEEGIETCMARGQGWESSAVCNTDLNQVCDPDGPTCRTRHTLSINYAGGGGVVRSQPIEGQPEASINCTMPDGSCTAEYFEGTTVTLVATALPQGEFVGWGGACRGPDPTCTITIDAPTIVGAVFQADSYAVSVDRVGGGQGTVTSNPDGIDCGNMCNAVFDRDLQVTFTAEPAPGSVFDGWRRDCDSAGNNLTCTITMDGTKRVRARFVGATFPLVVTRAGAGAGIVTSEPEGIDCGADCEESYDPDTMITLTASAAAGSFFQGWTGDCQGSTPTCMVTMDEAKAVTAQFEGIAHPLDVTSNGPGRVTSPDGIDCGTNCANTYPPDTVVQLTAVPDANGTFAGWGGDCAPAGTNLTCDLTMDGPKTVSATFDLVPFYLLPLTDDDCTALLRFEAPAPLTHACGPATDATVAGTYTDTPSRNAALGNAYLAGGVDEQGYIDLGRAGPVPPSATFELTVRKDGIAFEGRGRAALVSDLDLSDPATQGFVLYVLDDGRLVATTRDGTGGTTTASSAPGAMQDGTWHHVAATVGPAGINLFIDGTEVGNQAGAALWTASSSTAWVGAAREAAGDAIYRLNGAIDEVRVSNVVQYP